MRRLRGGGEEPPLLPTPRSREEEGPRRNSVRHALPGEGRGGPGRQTAAVHNDLGRRRGRRKLSNRRRSGFFGDDTGRRSVSSPVRGPRRREGRRIRN